MKGIRKQKSKKTIEKCQFFEINIFRNFWKIVKIVKNLKNVKIETVQARAKELVSIKVTLMSSISTTRWHLRAFEAIKAIQNAKWSI